MCNSDRFSKVEAQALLLHDEFWLDTILYFRNYREIIRRYNDWKDIDHFYFIPLKLNMTYSIGGHSISMADGTVYLGTFIRNPIEHPELFTFKCPKCGKTLDPYGYNGSPLSGRVDMQGYCDCGWGGYIMYSGWHIRSKALKSTQKADFWRHLLFKLCKRYGEASTVKELIEWLSK